MGRRTEVQEDGAVEKEETEDEACTPRGAVNGASGAEHAGGSGIKASGKRSGVDANGSQRSVPFLTRNSKSAKCGDDIFFEIFLDFGESTVRK